MPTLWKHPDSQYWFAKITLPDGRRTSRTTKQTDKNAAMQAAFAMERVALLARRNELTQSAVVKLAADLCERIGAPAIVTKTISGQCREYLAAGNDWSPATLTRYTTVIDAFLKHLGTRGAASLSSLQATEIEAFRTAELASGKGTTTVNYGVRVLGAVFSGPTRRGEIPINPAKAVDAKKGTAQERQPFAPSELAALLAKTKGAEWEGMILFGGHCGTRITDTARMTWGCVDLDAGILEFKPSKTRTKTVRLALHPEVAEWLKTRRRGIGKAPIFPKLHTQKPGNLSNMFSAIMDRAGIVVAPGEARTGKGRTFRTKGFHALRHTMISRMANADVSQDVRRAIAGHASDAAHERYVHLNVETQRRAVDRMPKLGA